MASSKLLAALSIVVSVTVLVAQDHDRDPVPQALVPRDEGAGVQGFASARKELDKALRRRDVTALLALLAVDVRPSVNDEKHGRADFIAEWQLRSVDTKFWVDARRLLTE